VVQLGAVWAKPESREQPVWSVAHQCLVHACSVATTDLHFRTTMSAASWSLGQVVDTTSAPIGAVGSNCLSERPPQLAASLFLDRFTFRGLAITGRWLRLRGF
jgi:hypothetical protein